MTLKLAQFCDDPKRISTKSSYPQKILIFLKTPKNIEIQNIEPKKMVRAYVYVKISEYPPPPPPPWGLTLARFFMFSFNFSFDRMRKSTIIFPDKHFWCSKEFAPRDGSFEHQKLTLKW